MSVILYYGYITECQTEDITCTVPWVCVCTQLQSRPEFSVNTKLKGNDKLTHYYTSLPTYDSFVAFVQYLTPEAAVLTPWNGSNIRDIPIINQTISDKLFSVLIRLGHGLEAFDVSIRFQISEATYSKLLATRAAPILSAIFC